MCILHWDLASESASSFHGWPEWPLMCLKPMLRVWLAMAMMPRREEAIPGKFFQPLWPLAQPPAAVLSYQKVAPHV